MIQWKQNWHWNQNFYPVKLSWLFFVQSLLSKYSALDAAKCWQENTVWLQESYKESVPSGYPVYYYPPPAHIHPIPSLAFPAFLTGRLILGSGSSCLFTSSWDWSEESPVGDWKEGVGRESSGLFFSPPSWSWLWILIMVVTFITTELVGQPLLYRPSSRHCNNALCPSWCFMPLGASDVSLLLISWSLTSISSLVNLFHIFVNMLLSLLRSHLSTILCLLRLT